MCKINRKRVDGVFGRSVIENDFEWKDVMGKTVLVEAAHGGMEPSIPIDHKFVNFQFIRNSSRRMPNATAKPWGVSCFSNWTEVQNWMSSMTEWHLDITGSGFDERPRGYHVFPAKLLS